MRRLAVVFTVLWTALICAGLVWTRQGTADMIAIPATAALIALLPWPRAMRFGTQVSGVLVLTLFVVATAATVGILFLPSAVAARAAASPRSALPAAAISPVSPAPYTAGQRAG